MNDKKISNQVLSIAFIFFLVGLLLLNIIMGDLDISAAERRKLKTFPKFQLEAFMDGSYMEKFEAYALDQFPFRESFRIMKNNLDFYVLRKKDVNDIVIYKDHLIKLETLYKPESIDNFNHYIQLVSDKYLSQSKVYLSIIPDKAYYIPNNTYPTLDYDRLQASVLESLDTISYINIFDQLDLEDYYYTDTHWKQENLLDIVDYFGETIGFETSVLPEDYNIETYKDFMGVYYSQSALKVAKDDLLYLITDDMNDMVIKNYEDLTHKNGAVYDIAQLDSLDPYNVFLSGASPLIKITNPNNSSGKELILFRDSYGSSLAPLLLQGYSKVTLIDTRYMSFDYLGEFVEFADKDVLFLYNTTIINNSQMLK